MRRCALAGPAVRPGTARLALVTLALGAACRTDPTSVQAARPALPGVYTLRTVSGQALPYTTSTQISLGAATLTILSQSFTLNADGTFVAHTVDRVTLLATGAVAPDDYTSPGTWSLAGGVVTLNVKDGATFTGAVVGDTLTIAAGPALGPRVYEK